MMLYESYLSLVGSVVSRERFVEENIVLISIEKGNSNLLFTFFFVSNTPRDIEMADEVLVIGSPRYDYVMERAKYLFSPMDVPNGKRKGQIWVMTWHGAPLKTIGLLRQDNATMRKHVKTFRNCDYFCNTASVFKDLLKKSFDLTDNVFVNTGLPRNDILLCADKDNIAASVRKKLGKKIKKFCFIAPLGDVQIGINQCRLI